MTSGYSSRIVDVNPANSGGTAADEAVGGASGSGESRTMLMTAPDTPTNVIGTHIAAHPTTGRARTGSPPPRR